MQLLIATRQHDHRSQRQASDRDGFDLRYRLRDRARARGLRRGGRHQWPEMEAQFIAKNRPTSLLRRLATSEEVANMVVYVCSPQASATTGAALRVYGGVVRSIA